ncbi:hypothetical protein J6590_002395 [Homalodisca vitripennis]|nr:hypothetical protein J6590_002395 [Homalodisca vitripennis]
MTSVFCSAWSGAHIDTALSEDKGVPCIRLQSLYEDLQLQTGSSAPPAVRLREGTSVPMSPVPPTLQTQFKVITCIYNFGCNVAKIHDVRTATAGWLYVCDDCGKMYQSAHSVRRHRRYQCNKEPSFQCPHCPRRCKLKSNLQKHVANMHSQHARLKE